jgi:hypothetical protein
MHAKFGFIARFARDQQLRGCELQLLFKPSDQVLGILYSFFLLTGPCL